MGFASKELSNQFFGNNLNPEESGILDNSKFQNPTFKQISELISKLLKQKDSKDNFFTISDLIISSLTEYENKYPVEINHNIKEPIPNQNSIQENNTSQCDDIREEYLIISNDIHSILSNCTNLTINQKLEFCNSQRYFMKLFLKEMLIKINNK